MKFSLSAKVFAALLLLIVIFFTGLNTGKNIERFDKTYVPPTPTVIPTPLPANEPTTKPTTTEKGPSYVTFVSKKCGISFLIPSNFLQKKTSDDQIDFYQDENKLFITCNSNYINEAMNDPKYESSKSATLNSQNTTIYSTKNSEFWTLRNKDRNLLLFETSSSITPLIQQTVKLL